MFEFLREAAEGYGYESSSLPIDQLREKHFSRLEGTCYLDHAGTTLPSEVQLQESLSFLSTNLLANPHSGSPSSQKTTSFVKKAREEVLQWFGTNSQEYSVIFTAGSTASIKLVGETFPFTDASILRQTISNHTSCIGMRHYALSQGAEVNVVDNNDEIILATLQNPGHSKSLKNTSKTHHLFVYPAESNYSGRKFPLNWIDKYNGYDAKEEGNWFTLLDASAFVSTNTVDLSKYPFDYVTFSFHKLFGFPTGLGALLVRNSTAGEIMKKRYFGGGTVEGIIATESYQKFRSDISAKFEDGTIAFSNIATLQFGFKILRELGGMASVSRHCHALTQYLYQSMMQMKHYNNSAVCKIFGLHHVGDVNQQGSILAFILYRSTGEEIGYSEVEKLASLSSIHLRTGCFCNPGECQKSLLLYPDDIKTHISLGHVCWDNNDLIEGKATGAIRISLGYMSSSSECTYFLEFLQRYFVEQSAPQSEAVSPREITKTAKIKQISVYPIKSCGAFDVREWNFGHRGLLFDREWALIDVSTGRALSAKNVPKMITIKPVLDLDANKLIINAPGKKELIIPFEETSDVVQMKVCGDKCEGVGYLGPIDVWFSSYLEIPCRLVRTIASAPRACKLKEIQRSETNRLDTIHGTSSGKTSVDPLISEAIPEFSFANESQLLVINEESVVDMRDRIASNREEFSLKEPIEETTARFRANIVVTGISSFEEDQWNNFTIENLRLECLGPCVRCRMICHNPHTGEPNPNGEPLATLSEYRRFKGRVMFGRHVSCAQLQVDQTITLKTNQTLTINTTK